MKAKEYYQKLISLEKEYLTDPERYGGFNGAVVSICICFIDEMEQLAKDRKAHFNSAYVAIIKEQDNKWQALCKLEKRLLRDGFLVALKTAMPEFYSLMIKK